MVVGFWICDVEVGVKERAMDGVVGLVPGTVLKVLERGGDEWEGERD